jgi:hypothetical protein
MGSRILQTLVDYLFGFRKTLQLSQSAGLSGHRQFRKSRIRVGTGNAERPVKEPQRFTGPMSLSFALSHESQISDLRSNIPVNEGSCDRASDLPLRL